MEKHEDSLEHLRDIMTDLGSQTSAVSSVPAEILLKIFFLLLPETLVFSPYERTIHHDPARSVSQVCKMWRDSALSSSVFWAKNLDWNKCPEKWFKIILARSGTQDLHIVADLTWRKHGSVLRAPPKLLLKNIDAIQHIRERVKSLEVHVKIEYGQQTPDLVFDLKSYHTLRSLPALERIELVNVNSADHIHFTRFHIDPRMLTDADSRKLRVMRVSGLSISFNLPYHNLRVLSAVDLDARDNPHVTKWLHILQGMPNLVDLTIKGSFGDNFPPGRTSGGPIEAQLPKLTTLSLAGPILEPFGIGTFLSHIVTPKGCNLYFSGRLGFHFPSDEHLSALVDAFKTWFGRWRSEDYKSTELYICPDAKRFIIHNQSGRKPWAGSYFRISIGMGYPATRELTPRVTTLISTVSQSLVSTLDDAINRAYTLTVWSTPSPIVMSWKEFLSRFLSVTTLKITVRKATRSHSDNGGGAYTIKSILSQLASEGQPVMPSLSKIIIVKLDGQAITFDSNFLEYYQTELLQSQDPINAINLAIARSASGF